MGRLSIVVLFTPELARQREFYEKSLGMSPASAAARWVQFGTRDAALALRALTEGEKPRIELGFDVGPLEARLAQLASRGLTPAGKLEESADCRIARRRPRGERHPAGRAPEAHGGRAVAAALARHRQRPGVRRLRPLLPRHARLQDREGARALGGVRHRRRPAHAARLA